MSLAITRERWMRGCNFAMRDGRSGMQNGKERMNNRFSEGDASIRPHSWAGGRRARALTGSARRFLRSPAYACPVAGKQFARSYGWGSAKESTSAALATRNRPLLGKAATGQLGAPAANTERFVCHLLRAYSTLGRPTSTSTMVHRPLATSCSHHCISTSLRARPTHIGDLLSTRRYLPSRRTWSPLSCTAACRPTVADRCLPSRDRPLRDRFVMAGGRRDELTSASL